MSKSKKSKSAKKKLDNQRKSEMLANRLCGQIVNFVYRARTQGLNSQDDKPASS